MNPTLLLFKLLLLLILLVVTQFSDAQSLNVTLISGVTPKAKTNREQGMYDIKTTVQPYEEVGFDLRHKLFETCYYFIGLHVTGSGRSAFFNAPVEKINPDYDPKYYSFVRANGFDVGLSVPLTIEKHWHLHQNESYLGQFGLQLHHSIIEDFDNKGYVLQDTNGNYVNVFELDVSPNNERKFWFTYSLGCGYERMLRTGNLLRVGLTANLSFTRYAKGIYTITIPGEPQTLGVYHANGSSIATTASYCFKTKNQRRIYKFEKQNNKL